MPQRRDYIDELKGLGILLVVLGHFIEQYRMGYSFVSASFFCIYAFHMRCSASAAGWWRGSIRASWSHSSYGCTLWDRR